MKVSIILILLFFIDSAKCQIPMIAVGFDSDSTLFKTDSSKNGKEIVYYPNSSNILIIIRYKNGEIVGKCIVYYPNGNKETVTVNKRNQDRNPIKEVGYYENGNKKYCQKWKFKKGKDYYKHIVWDEDGKKHRIGKKKWNR
ncbi:MAG: hypothetical protein ABIJ97_00460 [Bacteroidota bacterium]